MSAFSENALVSKLLSLNSSQQSIQTLSLWLIHHRKHHNVIIKTWYRELKKSPEDKKLTFMYLANDVIQNSKKKGPEFGREFCTILFKVFKYIGEECSDAKLFKSIERILGIWEERGVYDKYTIAEYRTRLSKKDKNTTKTDDVPKKSSKLEKRKADEESTRPKRSKSNEKNASTMKAEVVKINGNVETHVTLSPHVPLGDPPEPEELIKALNNLENSASSDAVVREQIANFPKEISEIGSVAKLEDKEEATEFSERVNEAVQVLNEYNNRLSTEMEDRTKLASMLRDFEAEQTELLAQASKRLEEYTQKLTKMKEVQKLIRDHLSNLPDLTQLPDVTGGLAPLPSAGDLFNLH